MTPEIQFYMNNDRYQQVNAMLTGMQRADLLTNVELQTILAEILCRIPSDIKIDGRIV